MRWLKICTYVEAPRPWKDNCQTHRSVCTLLFWSFWQSQGSTSAATLAVSFWTRLVYHNVANNSARANRKKFFQDQEMTVGKYKQKVSAEEAAIDSLAHLMNAEYKR